MRVRVLSKYTRVVKQSNSVSLENPTTEGGLSLADLSDYPPKFGRRLREEILCICSQIPPKFDLLTFAHTAFAHFTTYLSVVHYNKPLDLFMCKHLSDRVAYL